MYEQRKRLMISLFIKKTHCGFLHNTIIHLKHVILYVCIFTKREMTKATIKKGHRYSSPEKLKSNYNDLRQSPHDIYS